MATINGLTATRLLQLEADTVIGGHIDGDNLILEQHDGSEINAGSVRGFPGLSDMELYDPVGVPKPLAIATIPDGYGLCDGTTEHTAATYPILAAEYDTGPDCINGASAAGKFRLPDYRGKSLFGVHPGITAFNVLHKVGGSKDAVVVTHVHPATSDQVPHSHGVDQLPHNHGGTTTTNGTHVHGVDGDTGDRIMFTYPSSTHATVTIGGGDATATAVAYTHLDADGDHFHTIPDADPNINMIDADPAITTTVDAATGGVPGTDQNIPPYRTVNWIMRLA